MKETRNNYNNSHKKSNELKVDMMLIIPNKKKYQISRLTKWTFIFNSGSNVEIQQVGIHNFRLPLKFRTRDNGSIELETKVTGTVSLEAHKKGINMSRIMRSFYEYKNETFSIDKLEDVLNSYQSDLKSFDSKINLRFSYPIMRKSLISENSGYQYYNVSLQGNLDKQGVMKKIIHLILFILQRVLVHTNSQNIFVTTESCRCSSFSEIW